jgi:ribosome assembly protein RRB1
LSVDLLRDSLGEFRTKFPHTMYVAAGSQADRANKNKVSLLKLSDLSRNKQSESDSESDSDSEDATDDDPVIEERSFAHNGGVNRIRACPQKPHILATFSELGRVHLWDAEPYLKALDAPPTGKLPKNPELMSMQHSTEGFALDWSPVSAGRLASGDCNHQLYLWQPHQATWRVDKQNFRGHTESIEDIQWSPNEAEVFMTCSVDQSIRVWDCRAPQQAALVVAGAHDCDINVISWNR